jgi:hypothetical protein
MLSEHISVTRLCLLQNCVCKRNLIVRSLRVYSFGRKYLTYIRFNGTFCDWNFDDYTCVLPLTHTLGPKIVAGLMSAVHMCVSSTHGGY